jgi:hypothetical protein
VIAEAIMDNGSLPIEKPSKHRLEGNGNAALSKDQITKTALNSSAARFVKNKARTLKEAQGNYQRLIYYIRSSILWLWP